MFLKNPHLTATLQWGNHTLGDGAMGAGIRTAVLCGEIVFRRCVGLDEGQAFALAEVQGYIYAAIQCGSAICGSANLVWTSWPIASLVTCRLRSVRAEGPSRVTVIPGQSTAGL